MKAKCLMVQGTASSVGKSLLVTAFCRIFRRKGLHVTPFKSQNMSLNSFVTADGHEIGRAQAAQAEAAGIMPSSLMNPVLLKPTADHTSQVMVMGEAVATMDAKAYHSYRASLRGAVSDAYEKLTKEYDLIIIEGAGSPAEINLREHDLANMGMAEIADAPVLLAGDIDRGGVFASLYGTMKLLPLPEQERIRAFVINKFRGDVSILEPGLRELEGMLERPFLGVLPYWDIRIDEEDSLTGRLERTIRPADASEAPAVTEQNGSSGLVIAVPRLPRMSNFTDFAIFDVWPGVHLRYVAKVEEFDEADVIILPGSKNTIADMRFLWESGMAERILALHKTGVPVIGICGGFQMLGKHIRDPLGVDGGVGEIKGLGLLDAITDFAPRKCTVQSTLRVLRDGARGLLLNTEGMLLKGYEIHMGDTVPETCHIRLGERTDGRADGLVHPDGIVFGSYLHGIFDTPDFTEKLLNNLAEMRGRNRVFGKPPAYVGFREAEYDRLADLVEEHMDINALERIINEWPLRS